jgi:hypothetical protein
MREKYSLLGRIGVNLDVDNYLEYSTLFQQSAISTPKIKNIK